MYVGITLIRKENHSGYIPHLHPRTQSIHPTPGPDVYAAPRACIHIDLQRPCWHDIACIACVSLCWGVDRTRATAAVGPLAAVCVAAVSGSWLPGAVQDTAATQGTKRGAAGEHGGIMHTHCAGIEPSLRARAASNISLLQQGSYRHAARLVDLRALDGIPSVHMAVCTYSMMHSWHTKQLHAGPSPAS